MKTEQDLRYRLTVIISELLKHPNPRDYHRRMLIKEYRVLQWVLFE